MSRRFLLFLAVGLLNTAVGVGVIAGGIVLGLHPVLANALGFGVGLCVGFALNSRITFGTRGSTRLLLRYLLAFSVAYGVNLFAVLALDRMFPGHELVTYVAGIVPYTLVFFLLAEHFVYRSPRPAPGVMP